MNLKKYLRQQAEKDAESLITESDREFSMQLAQSVQQNPVQHKHKRFKLTAIASVAAAVIIAVILGVTLPFALNKNVTVDEIFYKEENIDNSDCTIEDVNSNVKYFQIDETENMSYYCVLNYDSVSGDKLFYSVTVTADISNFILYIVVNENYNFKFKLGENLSTEPLQKYNINYEVKRGDDTANYLGYIRVGTEIVYINYTQTIDIGEWLFFDEIESVLKTKN